MAIPEVPDLENLVKLKAFFEDFRQNVVDEIESSAGGGATGATGATGPGGGGGGGWTEIARGIVATGASAATIATAVAGRKYVLIAWNSSGSGVNWTSPDEDELTVTAVTTVAIVDKGTLSGTDPGDPDPDAIAEVVEFVPGFAAVIQASSRHTATSDFTIVELNLDDGDIIVRHVNGGGNTNGIYLVLERS